MADKPAKESYSRAEVDEILRRAAERMKDDGEPALSREELLDAARQAGIEPTFVHEAADEVAIVRAEERAIAESIADRKRRFVRSAFVWAIVGAGLLTMNLVGGGKLWFQWPLFGWGIAVALQALRAYRAPSPKEIEKIQRRARKRAAAEAREDAKRRVREDERERAVADGQRRRRAVKDFETAVDRGLTAILETATKKIESATAAPPPRPQTDFDRFVAKKKAEQAAPTARARVDVPAPKARVAVSEPDPEESEAEESDIPKKRRR